MGKPSRLPSFWPDVAKSNNCAVRIITNLNCIILDSGSKLHYIVSG